MKQNRLLMLAILTIILISGCVGSSNKQDMQNSQPDQKEAGLPPCPENISGLLTVPFVDPKYVITMRPLGDLNPPGHPEPVDHSTFSTNYTGKIPIYAPGDSWITRITEDSTLINGTYVPKFYHLQFVVCDGLLLDVYKYDEIVPELKDLISNISPTECREGITKPGDEYVEKHCFYDVRKKVSAGQLVGYTQHDHRGIILLEWYAVNYNRPKRTDVNWSYYVDPRYPHSICIFDLYSPEITSKYKFGFYDPRTGPRLRTVEPVCGEVNQNIPGTIQGLWFNITPEETLDKLTSGRVLGFIPNNVDPSIGDISIAGTIAKPGIVKNEQLKSGTINREFKAVKADGKVYCYNSLGTPVYPDVGKVLVQLIDDTTLLAEFKSGENCTASEKFSNPVRYRR